MTTENSIASITNLEYKEYLDKGINYAEYKEKMADDLASNSDVKIKEYISLNQHRMHRVEKTFALSDTLTQEVQLLKKKTYWLVLTEHWCGDASQILPALHKIESVSEGKIEMKLVYRDQNLPLMDQYLTNNGRSIPKLIQLDSKYNVTGVWGPRPALAQKLVKELKSNPTTADTYANQLHLWYAKDKQKSLEIEISELLLQSNLLSINSLS
ncbi:thioredoxin family protein [Flavobacterium laiguense]|uniref:Thioredoxin family protein n=1 Tax=Flavobacterium laiguense TaxID=2169409 RepID=A0A2U1JPB1_9FLAO|nr:thioredoxin family protein [Flavobacterium laiguense]PWA06723.1 thioredoxin family protein [Flavobacterium laiguense]